MIAAPSATGSTRWPTWPAAVAEAKGVAAPAGFDGDASDAAKAIAASRCSAASARPILLGNAAAQHPQASQLLALAQLDRRRRPAPASAT